MEHTRMSRELNLDDIITPFINDGWIDGVLFPVKSGKEATVYCCKAAVGRGVSHYALKAYKPREHRNFQNDAVYREGRWVGGTRPRRAVLNKSRFGRTVSFEGWLGHEYATLAQLWRAGAQVPRPVAIAGNAMLIEFLGEGAAPAPQLWTLSLSPNQAEALLEQALRSIEIMLSQHIVHGDLSAYNMLVADERLYVIDVPQAVDARTNPNASSLLARDVANVCRYFATQGADTQPGTYAIELWDLYQRGKI